MLIQYADQKPLLYMFTHNHISLICSFKDHIKEIIWSNDEKYITYTTHNAVIRYYIDTSTYNTVLSPFNHATHTGTAHNNPAYYRLKSYKNNVYACIYNSLHDAGHNIIVYNDIRRAYMTLTCPDFIEDIHIDGTYVYALTQQCVYIYYISTGAFRSCMRGAYSHGQDIILSFFCFHNYIATYSYEKLFSLYNILTHTYEQPLDTHTMTRHALYHDDSTGYIAYARDNKLSIYDIINKKHMMINKTFCESISHIAWIDKHTCFVMTYPHRIHIINIHTKHSYIPLLEGIPNHTIETLSEPQDLCTQNNSCVYACESKKCNNGYVIYVDGIHKKASVLYTYPIHSPDNIIHLSWSDTHKHLIIETGYVTISPSHETHFCTTHTICGTIYKKPINVLYKTIALPDKATSI
jgi:hypothetical protein